ncbi:MAG: hypothetical protein OXF98_05460, partial [Rhodospirillaceae bacterium]|nr:hypothetical protein [Rhodospirillaceae bacterium]
MAAELELQPEQQAQPRGLVDSEANERRLPFAFAKRHGVLMQGVKDGRALAVYRRGASAQSLAE